MTAEIVGNHDVVRRQAWSELLFDVGEEQLAIDRAVEQARRDDAIATQPAMKVDVIQCPCGTLPTTRLPRGARP